MWRQFVDDLTHRFGEDHGADDEGQPEDEQHVRVPRSRRGKRGEGEGAGGHAASRRLRQLTLQPNDSIDIQRGVS